MKKQILKNYFLIFPLLALTSCQPKSNAKNVALNGDILIKNLGENLEVYKGGVLVLKISLIGNAGQVSVIDSGNEISKLHWFYGAKKLDSFENAK